MHEQRGATPPTGDQMKRTDILISITDFFSLNEVWKHENWRDKDYTITIIKVQSFLDILMQRSYILHL